MVKVNEHKSELELFRSARPRFYQEVFFGETSFVRKGQTPELIEDFSEGLPTEIADWVAEEADGAVIGLLRIQGAPDDLRPVVMIDNEGSIRLTGFSLVDHFGNVGCSEDEDALQPLFHFCRKNKLPRPRKLKDIVKSAKKLGLTSAKLEKGKVPKIKLESLRKIQSEAPEPPPFPKKAKPPKVGEPSVPKANALGWALGPDGAPWIVTPPKRQTKSCRSLLHRWTGDRFVGAGHIPGWCASINSYRGQLVYIHEKTLRFFDGKRVHQELPIEDPYARLLTRDDTLVVYDGRKGIAWRLEEDELVKFFEEGPMSSGAPPEPLLVDSQRLALMDGENKKRGNYAPRVVNIETGKIKRWKRPPELCFYLQSDDWVVAVGNEKITALNIHEGTWKPAKKCKDLSLMAKLEDGRLFGVNWFTQEAFVVWLPKLTVRKVGAVSPRGLGTSIAVFEVSPGKVLLAGGSENGGPSSAYEPEIFDIKKGSSSALSR